MKDPNAVALGRKGGASKSEAKRSASAANGRMGGRPPQTARLRTGSTVIVQESVSGIPIMHGDASMVEATVTIVKRGMIELRLADGTVWRIES